jgi:hypothetical protein
MNLKKCTSLFLAFLLLVSSGGLAFNVHYCGGKIASVSSVYNVEEVCEMPAVPVDKACCAKKLAVEHKKCCSDKVVDFKGKANDVVVKVFSFQIVAPFVNPILEPLIFTPVFISQKQQHTTYYCDAHAPPFFKLYSQYIFYA